MRLAGLIAVLIMAGCAYDPRIKSVPVTRGAEHPNGDFGLAFFCGTHPQEMPCRSK